ncbi:MAG: hypothetical protein WKF60_08470 [Ilumatobacter sp.]
MRGLPGSLLAHIVRRAGIDNVVLERPPVTRRWRDGDDLMWQYPGYTARLERLGPPM